MRVSTNKPAMTVHATGNLTRAKFGEKPEEIGHVVQLHAFEVGVSDSLVRDTVRKTSGPCWTPLVDWRA